MNDDICNRACQPKGGVGKTTTAVNLGAGMATLGKKILLVDADAQGNATSGVGVSKADIKKDIYDVLVNEEPMAETIVHTSHKDWILSRQPFSCPVQKLN